MRISTPQSPTEAARTARGFTAEAFEAHADTLPLGSVQIEQERASNCDVYIRRRIALPNL